MKVLIHHTAPGNAPAGFWWLPKHQSMPQGEYSDEAAYPAGARAILGDSWDGQPFTLANWENQVERLTESSTPFSYWTVKEVKKISDLKL